MNNENSILLLPTDETFQIIATPFALTITESAAALRSGCSSFRGS